MRCSPEMHSRNMKGDAMHLFRRALFLSAILAGALAMTACPSQTTISKINQNPGKYQNKDVALIGTVTDSYGALGTGVYELDDGTGRISSELLYRKPPSRSNVRLSGGEHILRSAASVEQTFGGITSNLWDDPFEWTLPETLPTANKVARYLDEVDATRKHGFELFKS